MSILNVCIYILTVLHDGPDALVYAVYLFVAC